MLKIGIVEDNEMLRETVAEHLCQMGYRVGSFSCVEQFVASDFSREARILILDLNLPGEDGLSFSNALRAQGSDVGIIMFTARSAIDQRTIGYSSGADIYLTKPSSPEELGAAVTALATRLGREAIRDERLVLDPQSMTLTGPIGSADLTATEVDMLVALAASNQGRLPSERLVEICFPGSAETEAKQLLEVRITRLRRKLEDCHPEARIRAIRGWGYQFSTKLVISG